MGEPSVGAVLELVMAFEEARCVRMPVKERVAFLKLVEAGLGQPDRIGVLAHVMGLDSATSRADRRTAHQAFKEALPRLMAP